MWARDSYGTIAGVYRDNFAILDFDLGYGISPRLGAPSNCRNQFAGGPWLGRSCGLITVARVWFSSRFELLNCRYYFAWLA